MNHKEFLEDNYPCIYLISMPFFGHAVGDGKNVLKKSMVKFYFGYESLNSCRMHKHKHCTILF